MSQRRLRLPNQFLQSLVVGIVAFAAGAGVWYLIWPYRSRSELALAAGAVLAAFSAAASWMRSHDDTWEAAHLRTEPLLSPGRIRRSRQERRDRRASSRPVGGPGPAGEVEGKAEAAAPGSKTRRRRRGRKGPPAVPGFDDLANIKGRDEATSAGQAGSDAPPAETAIGQVGSDAPPAEPAAAPEEAGGVTPGAGPPQS